MGVRLYRLKVPHDTEGAQRMILPHLAGQHCGSQRQGENIVKNGHSYGAQQFPCRDN